MKAQQFADMHGVWCAWDADGRGFWFCASPVLDKIPRHWTTEGPLGIHYGNLPPDVERPDGTEGAWEQTLVAPKPDASKLVVDQPIMVRDEKGDGEWYLRYFAKVEGNYVWAYSKQGVPWYEWRLPNEEERRRTE